MAESFNGLPAFNGANPTLLPNLNSTTAAGGVLVGQTPAELLAANPRVAATDVGTLTTNPTDGDVLTLTVTNNVLPGGSLAVSVTAASDTVITAAAKLASALTSSLTAHMYDLFGTSKGDDTFTVNELGPVGNASVLSFASTGSTTCAFASSGVMSGGSGPIVPLANFSTNFGLSLQNLRQGQPVQLNAPTVAILVSNGSPIK